MARRKKVSRRDLIMGAAGLTALGVGGAAAEEPQARAGAQEPSNSRLETFRPPAHKKVEETPGQLGIVPLAQVTGVASHRFTFRENSNTPGRTLEQSVVVNVPPGSGFIVTMSYFTGAFTTGDFSRLTERPLGQFLASVGLRGNNLVCRVRLTDSNSDDPIFIEVDAIVLFFS